MSPSKKQPTTTTTTAVKKRKEPEIESTQSAPTGGAPSPTPDQVLDPSTYNESEEPTYFKNCLTDEKIEKLILKRTDPQGRAASFTDSTLICTYEGAEEKNDRPTSLTITGPMMLLESVRVTGAGSIFKDKDGKTQQRNDDRTYYARFRVDLPEKMKSKPKYAKDVANLAYFVNRMERMGNKYIELAYDHPKIQPAKHKEVDLLIGRNKQGFASAEEKRAAELEEWKFIWRDAKKWTGKEFNIDKDVYQVFAQKKAWYKPKDSNSNSNDARKEAVLSEGAVKWTDEQIVSGMLQAGYINTPPKFTGGKPPKAIVQSDPFDQIVEVNAVVLPTFSIEASSHNTSLLGFKAHLLGMQIVRQGVYVPATLPTVDISAAKEFARPAKRQFTGKDDSTTSAANVPLPQDMGADMDELMDEERSD